jgi:four helix bundle protein
MKNYKELHIWQKGIEIIKQVYLLTKQFPDTEKFGITSQITRAAVSIPANIAEGSSRNSDKDYARFLQLALGSAFEVQTYLVIAKELNWVKSEDINAVEALIEEEIKMIHRFINTLNSTNNIQTIKEKLTANG